MLDCTFCKIIVGDIPSYRVYESDTVLAFLDLSPLSEGHVLVIPKAHTEKLHEVSNDILKDLVIAIKKIIIALGCENYNVLQSSGKLAKQEISHVHFHIIPKTKFGGLDFYWVSEKDAEGLEELAAELKKKIH